MDGQSASFRGLAVLISVATWTAISGIVNLLLQPKRGHKWNARVVACIHGTTVTAMSLVFGIWCNPSPFTYPGGVSNFYEVLILVTCVGFLVFDLIFCVMLDVYEHETSIMAVHHLICMIGIMTSLTTGMSGTEISATIGLGECTNPMLNFRWFMRGLGLNKNDFWYQVNDAVFVLSFFIARGVIWPYLAYCVITHPRPTDIVNYLTLSFSIINILFLVGISEFACRKFLEWKMGHRRSRSKHTESKSEDTFEGITIHKILGNIVRHFVTRRKIKL